MDLVQRYTMDLGRDFIVAADKKELPKEILEELLAAQ